MIIDVAPRERHSWLSSRINHVLPADAVVLEGLDEADNSVMGMVGFELFTPNSVTVHIALERLIAVKGLLEVASQYAFQVANKKTVFAWIVETNEKSRKLAEHVGFQEVSRLKDYWQDGIDLVIYRLERAN